MSGISQAEAAQLYRNQGKEPPAELGGKPAKQPKLRNVKKTVNGIEFDSALEAEAYRILKLWQDAGAISGLKLQPTFTLQEKFGDANTGETIRAVRYSADFRFIDEHERERFVDVKGHVLESFRRTMKLMKGKYPHIEIEVWDRAMVKEMARR